MTARDWTVSVLDGLALAGVVAALCLAPSGGWVFALGLGTLFAGAAHAGRRMG